ncbi:MAG: ATP-binding protein, partial [Gemmobacter sp.]
FAKIEPNLRAALAGEASVLEFADDDSGRRIRGAFTPDRVGDGPINGVYILSMDVTAEAQARAALMQTRKRELAAQITSGLAHDFANLLTIILGLQARLARLDLPAEAAELVAGTAAAARRGGALLDRIGSISGRRELRPAATEIAAFLGGLSPLVQATLPEGVACTIAAEGPDGAVLLDQGAVQDALVNLVLNARDALAGRGGTIALTVRAIRDVWIEFTVEDDGPGFSPEALARGLDPFFTTKGGEGSGLGLAMVYDMAQLAGGTVRLANRAAGGARVTLRLPLRRPERARVPALVLLVEDDPDIRETVRDMLTTLGHSVIEAASVAEAEALASLPGIGAVLSDISLPGAANGVDLAERLAERGLAARLCLMTSLPPADPLRMRAAARFAVLAKPLDPGRLAAALE